MTELIQLVTQKTGIPQDKAQLAVQTVLSYLKDKLPAAVAGQIDSAVGGGQSELQEASKGIGGLFGKK